MTVTIHPEILDGDQIGWVVQHACVDEACADAVAEHQAAAQMLAAHTLGCDREMCATYGGDVVAVYGMSFPEVNISNINAAYLAGLLGFKWDGDCVLFDADDLLGRALMALAVNPSDAGVPAHNEQERGGVMIVNCGRPAGWANTRLAQLHEVCVAAAAAGRGVLWA